MTVHLNTTSELHSINELPDDASLFIPIACATIAAVGLLGTISHCFAKRIWAQGETPKNEPASVSQEEAKQKKTERNRIRNQNRRQRKDTSSDSSDTLALSPLVRPSSKKASSSSQSSSEGSSSSSTPRLRKSVPASQFIFTTSSESSSENSSVREQESLYVTENYIAMNVPNEQFDAFYNQALELFEGQRGFHPSRNPHITIADAQDTKFLKTQDREKIQSLFNSSVRDRELIPLRLKTVLHRTGENQPVEELLILDVRVSSQFARFRPLLQKNGYIRSNAPEQHQERDFHITLGKRNIRDHSQQALQTRLLGSNPVLSTVNWPGARL